MPEERRRESATRTYPLFYPGVERAVEPRDADDEGCVSFSQGAHELGSRQGLGQDDGQTGRQGVSIPMTKG